MSQEVTVFLPYKTGKGYSFYVSWSGEGELPYIRSYSVQGSLGLGSGSSKVAELVTVFSINFKMCILNNPFCRS